MCVRLCVQLKGEYSVSLGILGRSSQYMAHSAGFEPATARFVAEYSIQLSYECVYKNGVHYRTRALTESI